MERYPVLHAGIHDFFEEQELVIDKVQFEYLEGKYTGKGILTWNPDKGFNLQSFVTRHGPSMLSESFGGPRMIRKSDLKTIRMIPRRYKRWIIAPNIKLFERWDIRMEDRLSININTVIFSSPSKEKPEKYTGRGLYYGIGKNIVLPDSVEKAIILGNWSMGESAMEGIVLDEPEYQLVSGRRIRDKYLELIWGLDASYWKRSHSWIWPQAAAYALSILTGESVQLLCREVNRGSRIYVEMRRPREISSLGILSPFKATYPLDKIRFANLVEFFTKNSIEAKVCRHIFYQMLEASSQKSWQACELLLSSILEATLRTLQKKPYHPWKRKGRRIDIKQNLRKFCQQYHTSQLVPFCNKAHEVWERIRHRNAHPDWLYLETEPISDEWKSESLKDMVFLSRFYGYMILTLSGQRDFTPDFPQKPFR